jgi:hypothetical protein
MIGLRRLEHRMAALEARINYNPPPLNAEARIINDDAIPMRLRKKERM